MMTFNDPDIVELCRYVSIHRIIGLTNTGRRDMIQCPFHSDRTASLAIYPNNGFHCFGCGAHGKNAIDFVMLLDNNLNRKEAFKNTIIELKNYI